MRKRTSRTSKLPPSPKLSTTGRNKRTAANPQGAPWPIVPLEQHVAKHGDVEKMEAALRRAYAVIDREMASA